jgi:hypothetical protein
MPAGSNYQREHDQPFAAADEHPRIVAKKQGMSTGHCSVPRGREPSAWRWSIRAPDRPRPLRRDCGLGHQLCLRLKPVEGGLTVRSPGPFPDFISALRDLVASGGPSV